MSKPFSTEAEIERIGCRLLDRSLPKSEWTHAAHFAAALWLLRHWPDLDSSEHMPVFIRAYNEATGVANTDTGGYHETITQASLRAAKAFLRSRPSSEPLHEVVDGLMASRLGRSDWLLDHWSRARLFTVEARRSWVEPDLAPLAF